jgi:hypothetical protein
MKNEDRQALSCPTLGIVLLIVEEQLDPLPLSGLDLIAIAAVGLGVAVAGLAVRHSLSERRKAGRSGRALERSPLRADSPRAPASSSNGDVHGRPARARRPAGGARREAARRRAARSRHKPPN